MKLTQRVGGTLADLVVVKKDFIKMIKEGPDNKNILFMFLLENVCLTNELFWNFAHELIINQKIILNDIKAHIC